MVVAAKTGTKIFTPQYIEEMRAPRYKRSEGGSSSTCFGYMHPCIPYGVINTIGLNHTQQNYRVMEWGPGIDCQDFNSCGQSGLAEPLEVLGHFLARGKTAVVEVFDLNQSITRFTSHLRSLYCGRGVIPYLAKGFGVPVREESWGSPCVLSQEIPAEKLAGISFHQADILKIEEVKSEPYDLIFILNVFNCLSPYQAETKDHVFYHAIQLLKPNGLLVFNDYNNYQVPDWRNHFSKRVADLGLYGWFVRYSDKRSENCAYYVLNGEPPRARRFFEWPIPVFSRLDCFALQGDYRMF